MIRTGYFSFCFIVLLLLAGCEVQKRKYQRGFYFSSNLSSKPIAHTRELDKRLKTEASALSYVRSGHNDTCDVILFNDGTQQRCIVTSANENEIKYRKCEMPDGPLFTARKSLIRQIRYMNGETVILNSAPPPVVPRDSSVAPAPVAVPPGTAPPAAEPELQNTPQPEAPASANPCDRVVFRDGTEEDIITVEILPSEVKYKKCSMPDGPVYVVDKARVFIIKYANGTRDVFKEEAPKTEADISEYHPPVKKKSALASWALIAAFGGIYPFWFAGSIAAIIMGAIQLSRIRQNPEEYSGEKVSKAAITIGIISICLTVLILFLAV